MKEAQILVKKLQEATGREPLPQKFWENFSSDVDIPTFQDVLDNYAKYYGSLSSSQKEEMSKIFWEQVKAIGTPIIEDHFGSESECDVYFLMPKDSLVESEEVPGTKKDLYLQGDFHGYGSIDGRQRLLELEDTGIMLRRDNMPRESIATYQYIQVEPSYRGTTPQPQLPPFFNDDDEFVPIQTNTAVFPDIPQTPCSDEYSTHNSPYPGFSPERILRVSADSTRAHIPGEPIDWPSLLSTETPVNTRHFAYHATLYSDQLGDLHRHRSEVPVTKYYHDELYHSDQATSPYAHFTRDIHVFKPASGKIDNVIVVNDGRPYLITGLLDHFEKMAHEKRLSSNTAFVFIDSLSGLKATLSQESVDAFNKDPSANLPGMGVRLVDYKHGVDQYIDFIATKLFPQLKKELSVPDDPSHRVMIGSSLSGTASIYIGLKRPDLFGAVIALSPSPDNRVILSKIPRTMLTERAIYLSCGTFEDPKYAAANANIEYAKELSHKLGIPLHTGAYGHQFMAWNEELEQSLPATLVKIKQVSLEAAREINQYYKVSLEDANAGSAASVEGNEAEEGHNIPSPFQMTPKPFKEE